MTPVILIVHGSRDPKWRQPFEAFKERLLKDTPSRPLYLAYMEIASPTLLEVCEQLHKDGHLVAKVLPFFMASGGHVDSDIPKQISVTMEALPGLRLTQLPPIGEHPDIQALMQKIVLSELSS